MARTGSQPWRLSSVPDGSKLAECLFLGYSHFFEAVGAYVVVAGTARTFGVGKLRDNNCKICGSAGTSLIKVRSDLSYFACPKCDYCEKLPSSEGAHADFEASQSAYYENPSVDPFSEPAVLAKERLDQKARVTQKYVPAGSRLLEVGPGSGTFLSWAKAAGYICIGAEHSPVLRTNLEAQGFEIFGGEFERSAIDQSYDAVCSFHIIEHVETPIEHLKKALAITLPGGQMIVATPNAGSWQQKLFPKLSPNFDFAHLHVFSDRSLRMLAEEVGWTVVARLTPEYTSGWLRIVSKVVRKMRGEDEGATAGKYSNASKGGRGGIAIRFIAVATSPFRALQSSLGGGNEVMLVLRKPPAAS